MGNLFPRRFDSIPSAGQTSYTMRLKPRHGWINGGRDHTLTDWDYFDMHILDLYLNSDLVFRALKTVWEVPQISLTLFSMFLIEYINTSPSSASHY